MTAPDRMPPRPLRAAREIQFGRMRPTSMFAQLAAEVQHQRTRAALARELTAAVGCPLRDRYGYAASDHDVLFAMNAVAAHPDDKQAADAIGMANMRGDVELAMATDTPTDEDYERRIVAALRPLVDDRRDAAARGLQ